MEDKGESGGKYRFGSHWQTIQRSLFPDWEREADEKAVEEEKHRRAEAKGAGRSASSKTPKIWRRAGGTSDRC